MDDSARPFRTVNLRGRADGKTNSAVAKECLLSTTVAAEIKVDICTVLVSTRQPILCAERVAVSRAQIVDHNDNAGASVAQLVAR